MQLIEQADQSGEIQVTSLVDDEGRTLINRAACDNSVSLAESLISYVAKRHAKFLRHKEFLKTKLGDS
jgi:hypothetical protein